jgi:acyl-CoA thioesterase-1
MHWHYIRFVTRCGAALCITGTLLACCIADAAAAINIVALGASNTRGKAAGGPAWPEYLQGMLRAKGYEANVTNAGVDGDTTGGMLSRLDSAVPADTQLVILQPSVRNDARRGGGGDTDANIATMMSRLRARHIKVILFMRLARFIPASYLAPDGRHITTEGHRLLAAHLLPQVIAAIGRRR